MTRTKWTTSLIVLLISWAGLAAAQPKKAIPPTAAEPSFNKSVGDPRAPITVEVYSDFECPHCRELYLKTLRRVIPEYVESNKVYLVHHDFPLAGHRFARDAARWATAAGSLGRYEAVTAQLFEDQAVWSADGKIEPVVAKAVSAEDLKKIKQVLQKYSSQVDASIDKDIYEGHVNQVIPTPTMFIKNKGRTYPQAGVVQFFVFKTFLDQLLEQK